jgi:dihydroorotase
MNSRLMRRAMEAARALDLPVIDHCEDLTLSAGGDMHECIDSVRWGLRGIPGCAEDIMVARDIILAEATGARFHVAHLSTAHSVEMVAFAKSRGLKVTSEVTPHHLALHTGAMRPYDSHFKMKPPLRGTHDVEAALAGAASGAVDCIATDHAPHAGDDKMQEFEKCPFGVTGLETALGVCLDVLVHSGRLALPRLVAMLTSEPARVMGFKNGQERGSLSPGAAGDVTIFDPARRWTFDANQSASRSRNSPFDGRAFTGGPVATIVAGQVVWRAPGC